MVYRLVNAYGAVWDMTVSKWRILHYWSIFKTNGNSGSAKIIWYVWNRNNNYISRNVHAVRCNIEVIQTLSAHMCISSYFHFGFSCSIKLWFFFSSNTCMKMPKNNHKHIIKNLINSKYSSETIAMFTVLHEFFFLVYSTKSNRLSIFNAILTTIETIIKLRKTGHCKKRETNLCSMLTTSIFQDFIDIVLKTNFILKILRSAFFLTLNLLCGDDDKT